LVTGRSQTLAVIVSDIRNPFFAEVARGAEDAAYAAGCDLVLCNSDLDTAKQVRYIDSLLAKRVDGILMNSISALTNAQQDQLANCGVPVILLNRSSSRKRFSTILADNNEGGVLAAKHLISLGHRRLMHLTGPSQHGNFMDRMKGFLKATQNAGLPDPIVVRGQHTFSGGYEMAKKALAKNRTATAVFAANDVIAFGCIRAALESGIRIPDELSLIGFDNIEMSQITCPPLTTIDHPKYEIGKSAVEMLLKMSAGEGYEPEHRVIGVRLVQRESCSDIRPAGTSRA
jgi:LacI family transcriptional regulator